MARFGRIDRAAGRFNRWFGATAVASNAEPGLPGDPSIDARSVTTLLGELEQPSPEPRTAAISRELMQAVAAFGVLVLIGATVLWFLERTENSKTYAGESFRLGSFDSAAHFTCGLSAHRVGTTSFLQHSLVAARLSAAHG